MIGKQVKININDEDAHKFTSTAYENMNGVHGKVIKTSEFHMSTRDKFLIKFDQPVGKLYGNGRPISMFWFSDENLETI